MAKKKDSTEIFTLFVFIGLTLFCALTNNGCQSSIEKQPETNKQTEKEKLNEPPPVSTEIPIDATKLFTEFTENEKKAREKYIGKTIPITGTICEVFLPRSPKILTESKTRNKTVGIMLFPETKESQQKLVKNRKSFSDFPEIKLYDLLEGRDQSALAPSDFSYWSDYGGVYCSFSKAFEYNEEKKKVSLICQISDYKKGGSEQHFARTSSEPIAPYATEDDEWANYEKNYGKKSFTTQNRVILTGCRELVPSEN